MIRWNRTRCYLGSVTIVALSTLFGVAAAMRAPDAMAQSTPTSAGTGAKEYYTRFQSDAGDGIRTVEINGRIRFSSDATRIEWMDDGAYLLVVTNDKGHNVRLRAEPGRNGQPSYRYEIDGRVKRSAADADHWLADTLPIAFRELGHDVEARVQGAYEQGGADEVLRMLAAIRSDHSASQHYVAFFGRKDLSDVEIISALSQLGAGIDADEELAKVLGGAAALYVERPAIRTSFLACLDQFDSDIVKRRLTRDLFGTETVSGNVPPTMVGSPGNC